MRDKFEMAVGRRVAKLRKEKQLTQAQLAEMLDVAPETISRLERGISIPSMKTFANISQALNISLSDFFNFEYAQKTRSSASEKEISRILDLLKAKKVEEIRAGLMVLKDVFKALKTVR